MTNQNFSDKERLADTLNIQKYTTDHYNSFANEAATAEVKGCVMNILAEEHVIAHELFDEMHRRGWYQTTPAQNTEVDKARTQFASAPTL